MSSFKSAFASARKAGKKTFTWEGKSYTTELASDKSSAPSSSKRPAAKPSSAPASSKRPKSRTSSSRETDAVRPPRADAPAALTRRDNEAMIDSAKGRSTSERRNLSGLRKLVPDSFVAAQADKLRKRNKGR